ncbi:hypothetical protein SAMN04488583_0089 [Mycobacterium sp. 88mf]|nr:hypothetical protein SAMN04488583_0089 [Mycobacterium sp. 88mf]SFF49890.1 hypothetical protein SAMN04488582_1021094 [Mycobacterium sp. 455mf]
MGRKELIICGAGYMSLSAITDEIAEAAADPRRHTNQQRYDWKSRARDLDDARAWLGPQLNAQVDPAASEVSKGITTELLPQKTNGTFGLDDSKRPHVLAKAQALGARLQRNDTITAAWRDFVAACQSTDHLLYPTERVKFLRDTVVALCTHKNQDLGPFGPLHTAADLLLGNDLAVRRAQLILGDIDGLGNFEIGRDSDLTPDALEDLAARIVAAPSPGGDYVVWFRVAPAFVKGGPSVSHGDLTFYDASRLATALTDPDVVREMFDVIPEELLIEEVRQFQASTENGPTDTRGFQWDDPALVYARVLVHDVERHRAVARGRVLLDAILQVNGTPEDAWKVLGGHLLFGETERFHYHSIEWGLKGRQDFGQLYYQNDHFTESLQEMTNDGHVITAESARTLAPVLRLQTELLNIPPSDAEATVRAAVRAIEHCNTWTTLGALDWAAFINEYLLDVYLVETFAHRAVTNGFDAAVRYLPDHSPGAPRQPELDTIRANITTNDWSNRIVRSKTVAHTSTLRRIYTDHWLGRRLAELDDTISSAKALAAAFQEEQTRTNARVDRLRRSRNAAIHGGPLSTAACESIADFARRIARMALNNVVRATVDNETVDAHTKARRDEYHQRSKTLQRSGDLEYLFAIPKPRPPLTSAAEP